MKKLLTLLSLTAATLTYAQAQIYTFESDGNGFNTKNFFYDNGEEVVVFDTQFTPEIAKKSLDFIKSKTKSPITHVVITHPNPDKFNGMSVFQEEGAKVIASAKTNKSLDGVHQYKKYYFVNMAKMFTEESYPKLGKIDQSFESDFSLTLKNGEKIQLQELSGPGVSSNQTIAYIEGINALIVGDLVHHKAHAWLEGGIVSGAATPTISGWVSDLKQLQREFKKQNPIVYGGRGEAAKLNIATKKQISYLETSDKIVNSYIKKLGAQKAELKSEKAGTHYIALEKLFAKKFPDYQLSYMIQYGIYGLVNSKL
jgi:glyoxylase-like metal-dependent hydrolase (beta-lactamase superfamily II)